MYTDDTILTFGKYKFLRLSSVPATYLLELYKRRRKPNNTFKHTVLDPEQENLYEYIEKNKERLEAAVGGKVYIKEEEKIVQFTCNKLTYASEKDAKYRIQRVRKDNREHKKPVRVYECDKCGGWHLTSISHEQWKKINPKK